MQLDQTLIARLRSLFEEGATVVAIVSVICEALQLEREARILVLVYFRAAFLLSLPEALPIGGWSGFFGGGTYSDGDIERMLRPIIAARQDEWSREWGDS